MIISREHLFDKIRKSKGKEGREEVFEPEDFVDIYNGNNDKLVSVYGDGYEDIDAKQRFIDFLKSMNNEDLWFKGWIPDKRKESVLDTLSFVEKKDTDLYEFIHKHFELLYSIYVKPIYDNDLYIFYDSIDFFKNTNKHQSKYCFFKVPKSADNSIFSLPSLDILIEFQLQDESDKFKCKFTVKSFSSVSKVSFEYFILNLSSFLSGRPVSIPDLISYEDKSGGKRRRR